MYLLLVYFFYYSLSLFFFNDTATTEIYTLSLHDALPISNRTETQLRPEGVCAFLISINLYFAVQFISCSFLEHRRTRDRKSTRLNSSHTVISYAVFCLKKKKKKIQSQKKHKNQTTK